MLYRPNFCNQCGEKIERAEWGVATSRRFCDLCATEHPVLDWAPKLLVAFFGITVLVGMKSVVFPSSALPESSQKPAEMRTLTGSGSPSKGKAAVEDIGPVATVPQQDNIRPELSGSKPTETFGSPQRVSKSTEAAVYTCGAPTKKGTPCSRKVKTKGFCWQHREPAE